MWMYRCFKTFCFVRTIADTFVEPTASALILQRKGELSQMASEKNAVGQIRRGRPPTSPSASQHVCVLPPTHTPPQHARLYTNAHTNAQTQKVDPPLRALNTNTAWAWHHNTAGILGKRAACSRSNDMALCPVTYITLAGCHTQDIVSRLMPGLRFTGNISHIFAIKTMANTKHAWLKVKFIHLCKEVGRRSVTSAPSPCFRSERRVKK